MAPIQTHAVIQRLLAMLRLLVSAVSDPAIRLQQHGGAQVLFTVPPVRGAGGAAAGAQDAFVEPVQLLAFRDGLAVFTALRWNGLVCIGCACNGDGMVTYIWRWRVTLEVGLDGFVLFVELCQVWHEVFDDVGVWQGVDAGLFACVRWDTACNLQVSTIARPRLESPRHSSSIVLDGPTQTSQRIHPINIHRTTPTNPLPTTPPKRQRRVHLVLNSNQRIEHHRPGLVQVEGVRLHFRLAGRLVRVPAVDVKRLDLRVLARTGLFDVAGLAFGHGRSRGRGDFGGSADGFAFGMLDCRCHAASEGERRQAPCCDAEGHGWCSVERQWQMARGEVRRLESLEVRGLDKGGL